MGDVRIEVACTHFTLSGRGHFLGRALKAVYPWSRHSGLKADSTAQASSEQSGHL